MNILELSRYQIAGEDQRPFRRGRPNAMPPHARASWKGLAHLELLPDGMHELGTQLRIFVHSHGGSAPWTCSFEDAVADDWFVMDDRDFINHQPINQL